VITVPEPAVLRDRSEYFSLLLGNLSPQDEEEISLPEDDPSSAGQLLLELIRIPSALSSSSSVEGQEGEVLPKVKWNASLAGYSVKWLALDFVEAYARAASSLITSCIFAKSLKITGVSGTFNEAINGYYDVTDETASECPVYRKRREPSLIYADDADDPDDQEDLLPVLTDPTPLDKFLLVIESTSVSASPTPVKWGIQRGDERAARSLIFMAYCEGSSSAPISPECTRKQKWQIAEAENFCVQPGVAIEKVDPPLSREEKKEFWRTMDMILKTDGLRRGPIQSSAQLVNLLSRRKDLFDRTEMRRILSYDDLLSLAFQMNQR